MAIGLTRTKNLSERNLNLKTALQKLYAPGIENDIALFSLSSSVESVVVSGLLNSTNGQIVGIRNESLSTISGEAQLRTKFLTKFFTFTDLNEVNFSKFTLVTPGGAGSVLPKTSQNGELYSLDIISTGQGFYFELPDGAVFDNSASTTLEAENVSIRGLISGKETAKAKITFIKHLVSSEINTAELTKFTPGSTDRYSVSSIEITDPGSGYIFPEKLELVEGSITLSSDDSPIVLKKQRGRYFSGQPELLRSRVYAYQVRGASGSGFFLYDTQENEYVYLGRNTSEAGFLEQEKDSIELRRFDGINISNFFQFKFAQSTIYLRNYDTTSFRIENGSISGEISRVASVTNNLQLRTQDAVQNTRRPTPSASSENILGYVYNSFDGKDVVIWQRLVLRDPDFVLDPNNPDFTANSITGTRLRESVQNFELSALSSSEKIRIPGLFIKVGVQYFRAFSTTDKPFFAENLNPKMSSGSNQYSLSAESLVTGSTTTLYSYDTVIAQLAQRISADGINGALYYHRSAAPTRRTVQAKDGNNASVNIYAIPLFSLR